jgi:hypothetical protein
MSRKRRRYPRTRKPPIRHTVHPRHPRYDVSQYPRGSRIPTKSFETKDIGSKAILRRHQIWLDRLQTSGMRDPNNPSKTLSPDHPLTKIQIMKIKTEIAYGKGNISLRSYQDRITGLDRKYEEELKRMSRKTPTKEYYTKQKIGKTDYWMINRVYPDGIVWSFDLSDVKSMKSWRAYLKRNKFRSVAKDPDPRSKRRIYRNPDGLIIIAEHEWDGMKRKHDPQPDVALGYMRFEAPKDKRKELHKVLKEFRGKTIIRGTDKEGDEVGGIATYIKQEDPNVEHPTYI